MDNISTQKHHPSILAPAGSRLAFLAAIAGKADAIYCGLKKMSARMAAINFSLPELIPLAALARKNGIKLHITLNSLLKPDELEEAGRLLAQLNLYVKPDALIIQDLAFLELARQTGFSGEIHLSTLANVSFSTALPFVEKKMNVHQVVIPRELTIDEIKQLAVVCPKTVGLEIFVHGALCYGVSGRCYWSSYMGGKSGLRGRCVQPCRRIYNQGEKTDKFFSCQDLSLDVLVKVLLDVPQIKTWKIEGRKKGPHYVYYTVSAYRLLRDHGKDPQAKKDALYLLERALGRSGTHYAFLPQRPQHPIQSERQTGSGMLMGRVKGGGGSPYVVPRESLYPGDKLRIGYEDESWHAVVKVSKSVPKHGKYNLPTGQKRGPKKGLPVFLVDRLEPALKEKIEALTKKLPAESNTNLRPSAFNVSLPKGGWHKSEILQIDVSRGYGNPKNRQFPDGRWVPLRASLSLPKGGVQRTFWWLPPVMWPSDENDWQSQLAAVIKNGGKYFVLNAPWQVALFEHPENVHLWAGPFCNVANPLAIASLKALGFKGVIISPELGEKEIMALPKQSLLPLGIVISGHFPLCISRNLSPSLSPNALFRSPKGEDAWAAQIDNDYWVFANWPLDLAKQQQQLMQAGYRRVFIMRERVAKRVKLEKRPGVWYLGMGLP